MKKQVRMYGYQRDFKDPRDMVFKAANKNIQTPPIINLNGFQSPVEDQEDIGSCVGQGAVGNLEFLLLKNSKNKMVNRIVQDAPYYDLSRLMLYYEARKLDGMVKEDSGAQIRNAIKALSKVGVCHEDLWPYVTKKFAEKPTEKAYEDAKSRKIKTYHRLHTLTDMFNCLAEGFPFIFGVTVYESFESTQTSKTGIVKMPTKNEGVVGGHCMLCTGYNKDTEMFDLKNSWGTKWGDKGFGRIPFEYMEAYSADSWVIKV